MKILLCALACAGCLSTYAQETETVQPFRNLSVGIEVGTTGIGFEVATKLHKNFQLRAGFTTLSFIKVNAEYDIDTKGVDNADLDVYVNRYPGLKNELEQKGLPTSASGLDTDVDLKAKTGLANGKILVDYYPWSHKSSFHLTAGAYFGSNKIVKVDGYLPQKTIDVMNTVNDYLASQNVPDRFSTVVTIGDKDIDVNDLNGHVDAFIKTNAFKPYIGFGFGRAVPRNRVGVQFDMGVMFHGKPKISSSNSDISSALNDESDEEEFTKIMRKVIAYPVLSLKIVGRIF